METTHQTADDRRLIKQVIGALADHMEGFADIKETEQSIIQVVLGHLATNEGLGDHRLN